MLRLHAANSMRNLKGTGIELIPLSALLCFNVQLTSAATGNCLAGCRTWKA